MRPFDAVTHHAAHNVSTAVSSLSYHFAQRAPGRSIASSVMCDYLITNVAYIHDEV